MQLELACLIHAIRTGTFVAIWQFILCKTIDDLNIYGVAFNIFVCIHGNRLMPICPILVWLIVFISEICAADWVIFMCFKWKEKITTNSQHASQRLIMESKERSGVLPGGPQPGPSGPSPLGLIRAFSVCKTLRLIQTWTYLFLFHLHTKKSHHYFYNLPWC